MEEEQQRLTFSEECKRKLYDFVGDESLLELEFPPTLSSLERSEVHRMCESMGLGHESVGEGNERRIRVSKERAVPAAEFQREHQQRRAEAYLKKLKKKERGIPLGMSEIVDGFLWLGSGRDANDITQLRKANIERIVNVAKEWRNKFEEANSELNTIQYFNCDLLDVDHEPLHKTFEQAFTFIDAAECEQKRVLVHCVVGKSRSSALVMAWLMRRRGMTLREAFFYVKERRELVQPNDGFMHQLLELEEMIVRENDRRRRRKEGEEDDGEEDVEEREEYVPSMKYEDWEEWTRRRNNAKEEDKKNKQKKKKQNKNEKKDKEKEKRIQSAVKRVLDDERMKDLLLHFIVKKKDGRQEEEEGGERPEFACEKSFIPLMVKWVKGLSEEEDQLCKELLSAVEEEQPPQNEKDKGEEKEETKNEESVEWSDVVPVVIFHMRSWIVSHSH